MWLGFTLLKSIVLVTSLAFSLFPQVIIRKIFMQQLFLYQLCFFVFANAILKLKLLMKALLCLWWTSRHFFFLFIFKHLSCSRSDHRVETTKYQLHVCAAGFTWVVYNKGSDPGIEYFISVLASWFRMFWSISCLNCRDGVEWWRFLFYKKIKIYPFHKI